jgi:PPP family 3-phenylpropionic acid transporter
LLAGWWLDLRGIRSGDALAPLLISAGYGLSFLAALGLRGQGSEARPHLGDVRRLLGDYRFLFLLVIAGLHWAALVPYHGFFGILMQDRGFAATTTSYAFFVGSAAEIVVFLAFSRLRARFTLEQILAASFAVSALRWWLFAHTHSAFLVVALQVAHALTFGAFWAAAMTWIADCVPAKLRATGQVMFSMVLGAGSTLGLLLAGALYDAAGGADTVFTLASVVELLPLTLVLLSRSRRRLPTA